MRDLDFFGPVRQYPHTHETGELLRPVFFYDSVSFQVSMLTPIHRIRALLPSSRLHPMRFTPTSAVTTIVATEHRDSDVGAYRLAAIGFPVTVDKPAPVLVGLLSVASSGASIFPWQMPETSQFAVDMGVAVAGYPKFMAEIDMETTGERLSCVVTEGEHRILRLSVPKPTIKRVDRRWPGNMITVRDGWVQRVPFVTNIRHMGATMRPTDVELELGDHPVADELRGLRLGRPINVQFTPDSQQILGTVLDGWPVERPVTRWSPA